MITLLALVTLSGVIGILIQVLIFALVIAVIFWVLGMLGVPPNIQRIISAIIALIFLLWILRAFLPGV